MNEKKVLLLLFLSLAPMTAFGAKKATRTRQIDDRGVFYVSKFTDLVSKVDILDVKYNEMLAKVSVTCSLADHIKDCEVMITMDINDINGAIPPA